MTRPCDISRQVGTAAHYRRKVGAILTVGGVGNKVDGQACILCHLLVSLVKIEQDGLGSALFEMRSHSPKNVVERLFTLIEELNHLVLRLNGHVIAVYVHVSDLAPGDESSDDIVLQTAHFVVIDILFLRVIRVDDNAHAARQYQKRGLCITERAIGFIEKI